MASRKAPKRVAAKARAGTRSAASAKLKPKPKPKVKPKPKAAARPAAKRAAPRIPREAMVPVATPAAPPRAHPEFREHFLDRMRQSLLAKRRELVSGVRGSSKDSMEASAEVIQDIADQASTAYTKEFLLSIGDTERRLLQQVDAALDKIRRKSYGFCEKCGEPIGEKRLEALPFAKFCIRCQEEEEEERR